MAMTIKQMPWIGSHGDAASIANTGYNSVLKTSSSSTMVFNDTWKPRGVNCILNTGTTASGYALGILNFAAPTDTIAFEQPMKPVTVATAEQALVSFHQTSDARQFSVVQMSDASIMVRNGANTNAWRSAAGVLAANTEMTLSIYFTRHASTGSFRVVLYNADGSTRADSTLLTNQNTGSTIITHVKATQTKSSSSSTIASTYYFGVPRYSEDADGLLPLWAPPARHSPAKMLINGVLTPVKMRMGNGTSTGIPIL